MTNFVNKMSHSLCLAIEAARYLILLFPKPEADSQYCT